MVVYYEIGGGPSVKSREVHYPGRVRLFWSGGPGQKRARMEHFWRTAAPISSRHSDSRLVRTFSGVPRRNNAPLCRRGEAENMEQIPYLGADHCSSAQMEADTLSGIGFPRARRPDQSSFFPARTDTVWAKTTPPHFFVGLAGALATTRSRSARGLRELLSERGPPAHQARRTLARARPHSSTQDTT